MLVIDKLAYSSRFKYKSPYLKTIFSVGSLVLCVSAASMVLPIITLFIMGGLTIYGDRMKIKRYIRFLLLPLAFLFLSTVSLLINFSDSPFQFVSFSFRTNYIGFERETLVQCIQLILKALGAVSCLYFLSMTTTVTDLIMVLKRVHCPALVIELMLLIYRYLFVVFDMADALVTARNCRMGNRNFWTALKSMGSILGVLFVRSLKKSGDLYNSMESRGYHGDIKVLSKTVRAEKNEIVSTILILMLLILVRGIWG